MKSIQMIEISVEELSTLIKESIRIEIQKFQEDIKTKDELLTREQTAQFLQVDLSTLHHWTVKGKIKALKLGKRVYFTKKSILESFEPLKR